MCSFTFFSMNWQAPRRLCPFGNLLTNGWFLLRPQQSGSRSEVTVFSFLTIVSSKLFPLLLPWNATLDWVLPEPTYPPLGPYHHFSYFDCSFFHFGGIFFVWFTISLFIPLPVTLVVDFNIHMDDLPNALSSQSALLSSSNLFLSSMLALPEAHPWFGPYQ